MAKTSTSDRLAGIQIREERQQIELAVLLETIEQGVSIEETALQKATDEALLLSLKEMRTIITEDPDPEHKIKATNSVVAVGSYLSRRKAIGNTKKTVNVFIDKDKRIKGAEVQEIEDDDA